MSGRGKARGGPGIGWQGGRGRGPAGQGQGAAGRGSPAAGRGPRPTSGGAAGCTPPTSRGPGVPRGGGRFGASGSGASNSGGSGGRGFSPQPWPGRGGHGLRPSPGGGEGAGRREAGAGSAKLFGSGAEQIQFERDKEPGIWKVAPPPGQRFKPAFLEGLSKFVAFQLSRQPPQQAQQPWRQQPWGAAQPPLSATAAPPPPPPPAAAAAVGDVGSPHPAMPRQLLEFGSPEAAAESEASSIAGASQEAAVGASGQEQEKHMAAAGATHEQGLEQEAPVVSQELAAAASANWDGQQGRQHARREAHGAPGSSPMAPSLAAAAGAGTGAAAAGAGAVEAGAESGAGAAAGVETGAGAEGGTWESVHVELLVQQKPSQQQERGAEEEEEGGEEGDASLLTFLLQRGEGSAERVQLRLAISYERRQQQGQPQQVQQQQHRQQGGQQEQEGQQQQGEEGVGAGAGASRRWWPANAMAEVLPEALPVARVGREEEQSSASSACSGTEGPPAVQLSLRLERQGLTDREARLLADWHARAGPAVLLRKLWLFDNELGDEGARQVARLLHSGMLEVHLSHNRITTDGAAALLRALAAGACTAKPLWLRLEWNRLSLERLMQVLEAEHAERGLIVDLPQPIRADAAPSLPCLPAYLSPGPPGAVGAAAAGAAVGSGASGSGGEGNSAGGEGVTLPGGESFESESPGFSAGGSGGGGAAGPSSGWQAGSMSRGGGRNSLRFLVGKCHARLPWLACQYQLPAEAAVLSAVRATWQQAAAASSAKAAEEAAVGVTVGVGPGGSRDAEAAVTTAADARSSCVPEVGSAAQPPSAAHSAAHSAPPPPPPRPQQAQRAQQQQQRGGPLLLFPDTSALLSMLGAHSSVAAASGVTLRALGELAQQGRFGRALDPKEQVFVVVTDSVAKQLDGLKNDPGARSAIRHFMGQGLDAWGPAGLDFLTVLGGHEGEGLVVEHEAQVAGSRSADVGSVGQKMDHKIVEVALFFQHQILQAASSSSSASASAPAGGASGGSATVALAAAGGSFPVVLLSGDNAQVQLARSHGLPAVRLAELAPLERWLQQAQQAQQAPRGAGQAAQQPALGASLIRQLLGSAATTGLGSVAIRSVHREFDKAVAALRATAEALEVALGAQAQLDAVRAVVHDASLAPHAALAALRALLPLAAAPAPGAAPAPAPAGAEAAPVAAAAAAAAANGAEGVGEGGAGAVAELEEEQQQQQQGGQDMEAMATPAHLKPPPTATTGSDVAVAAAGDGSGLLAAVQARLAEWEGLVQSQQSPSRVLRWTGA